MICPEKIACTLCGRKFTKKIAMTNHRRWHDIALYKRFQKTFIKKLSESHLGERNPQWRGDLVGKIALHEWVGSRLNKPTICPVCGRNKTLDLHNKNSLYRRDLQDWEWLCRSCHMKKDGRLERLRLKRVGL